MQFSNSWYRVFSRQTVWGYFGGFPQPTNLWWTYPLAPMQADDGKLGRLFNGLLPRGCKVGYSRKVRSWRAWCTSRINYKPLLWSQFSVVKSIVRCLSTWQNSFPSSPDSCGFSSPVTACLCFACRGETYLQLVSDYSVCVNQGRIW